MLIVATKIRMFLSIFFRRNQVLIIEQKQKQKIKPPQFHVEKYKVLYDKLM